MMFIFSKFVWNKVLHKYSLNVNFHPNPSNIFKDTLITRFYQQQYITMNVNIDGKEKKARKYKKNDVQFSPNSHRREGQEGAKI